MYEAPRTDISFGDIFDASFIYDIFLKADAADVGRRSLKGGVQAFSVDFDPKADFVLSHGKPSKAILLTDNCAVDSALGQDRPDERPTGRLTFARVNTSVTQEELERLEATPVFGKFPLPPGADFAGGICELQRCFTIHSRDVKEVAGSRVVSIGEELSRALEVRIGAHVLRRGPLASMNRANKIEQLIEASGGDVSGRPGELVANAVSEVWFLEGEELETVAQNSDVGSTSADSVVELARALEIASRMLSEAATELTKATSTTGQG